MTSEAERVEDVAADTFSLPTITPVADLAAWLSKVASGGWSWARNSDCKYVTLRIDTRRGAHAILDRDGNAITFEHLAWQYSRETPQPPAHLLAKEGR
jgi:hypothetical protein